MLSSRLFVWIVLCLLLEGVVGFVASPSFQRREQMRPAIVLFNERSMLENEIESQPHSSPIIVSSSMMILFQSKVAIAADTATTTNNVSDFGKWFTLLYIGVSILAGMKEMTSRFQTFLDNRKNDTE